MGTVTVAIQGNTVYSNGIGVKIRGYNAYNAVTAQISNNLIYANVNQGILLWITAPTARSPTIRSISRRATAVSIQGGSSDISLENNILWVAGRL